MNVIFFLFVLAAGASGSHASNFKGATTPYSCKVNHNINTKHHLLYFYY